MAKIISIGGVEYKILPSLKNMCLVEDDLPGYNLALGVPREKINLHFMRSCIKRCIVTMDEKPLPADVFEDIHTRDTDAEFNVIFASVFLEMHNQSSSSQDEPAKN